VAVQAHGSRSWHLLAEWQPGRRAAHRRSPSGDPEVDTDVWRPSNGATAYRLRVTLHPSRAGDLPAVGRIGAVVAAGAARRDTSGPLRRTARVLDVPRLSQMTWQDVGGSGWCSPSSVAMVLSHAGTLPPTTDIPIAAAEVFDPAYDGTGNWSFNAAWAATLAGHAFVTRLRDLRDAERFVDAGIPLVASVAYPRGALSGAPRHRRPPGRRPWVHRRRRRRHQRPRRTHRAQRPPYLRPRPVRAGLARQPRRTGLRRPPRRPGAPGPRHRHARLVNSARTSPS
jgi:hypothetical protein